MMAQRDGVDFNLPDEILAVIPTDPYDQLDVARKITSMAIASRVTRLESDTARIRQQIADRDRTIEELQEKVERLDRVAQEYSVKLRNSLEENAKLIQERDMLSVTAKKLARNLAKGQGQYLIAPQFGIGTSQAVNNISQFGQGASLHYLQQPHLPSGNHLSQGYTTVDMQALQFVGSNPQSTNQPQGSVPVWDFL